MSFVKFITPIVTVILAYYLYNYYKPAPEIPVDGTFDERCNNVMTVFREMLKTGVTKGCAFAIYYKGKQIVNIWGGYSDHEFQIPWRKHSLSHAASVTKAVGSLAVSHLVQRGKLSYSDPIYKYWPEFASHGKERITVEMLLSYKSGLIGFDPKFPVKLLKKWATEPSIIDSFLVQQKPNFEPGTHVAYPLAVHGFYVDALVRHVDDKHRSVSQYFHDEIAKPFGIDFYIGLPRELFYRKTREDVRMMPWYQFLDFKKYFYEKLTNYFLATPSLLEAVGCFDSGSFYQWTTNDYEYASIPLLSELGFGTADAIAKLFSHLTMTDSKFLSKETISQIIEPMSSGTDYVLNIPQATSRGCVILNRTMGEDLYGHMGYGGQVAAFDVKRQMALAYLTNDNPRSELFDNPTVKKLVAAAYKCVDNF